MILLKKNDKNVVYSFGYEANKLDGKIEINLSDLKTTNIVYSSDIRVTPAAVYSALGKLLKEINSGEIPERIVYLC